MPRTDTREHLEAIARSKGIACQPGRNRTIELTTPCGGTTATCEGVRDALDTLRSDPAFRDLPIQLGKRKKWRLVIAHHPFITIETALEKLEALGEIIKDITTEYESAMDDPENGVEGWKPTDEAVEFFAMIENGETATKLLKLAIERK